MKIVRRWLYQPAASCSASVVRFFANSQAINIETIYNAIIGAAKSNIFGISLVGDTTAATIKMTISEIFQVRIINLAVTSPIRASTYVIAGI